MFDLGFVRPLGLKWSDGPCTVYKQRVLELWPRHLPAFQQQTEDKAGPDPFNTGADGRSTAINRPTVTTVRKRRRSIKEARVLEQLRKLDSECRVRDDMQPAEVEKIVKPHYGDADRRTIFRAYKNFLKERPPENKTRQT